MPDFRIAAAAACSAAELHAAFAAAFADYLIGPFTLPPDQWPTFLGRQAVSLRDSRVAQRGDAIAALALVAPRPDRACWRLATMGALPAARGSGAAPALLEDFIARARAAGQQEVELECFAQNERALHLYRRHGFVPLHALHGWQLAAGAPVDEAAGAPVEPVDLEDAFDWIDAVSHERGDLPLQVTPASLRALPLELRAWRCGSAQVVASGMAGEAITLHALIDTDDAQRAARALVAHVRRSAPASAINVPQLQREDLGGAALERLGFTRLPLHQLLMRRALGEGSRPATS